MARFGEVHISVRTTSSFALPRTPLTSTLAFTLTLALSNSGTNILMALTPSDNIRGGGTQEKLFRPLGAPLKLALSELLSDFVSSLRDLSMVTKPTQQLIDGIKPQRLD